MPKSVYIETTIPSAYKHQHLVVVNRRLALLTPIILTPEMLWEPES